MADLKVVSEFTPAGDVKGTNDGKSHPLEPATDVTIVPVEPE